MIRILGIDPGSWTTGIGIIDTNGKLGDTRGVTICAAVAMDLLVYEYAPKAVKQSVVGKGAAAKSQIQYIVSKLLNIKTDIQEDAADALAVAICHANSR